MKPWRLILFLAWRNVLRYRRRTIQSFLILFLGALSVMLIDAFLRGYAANSSERVVSLSGHVDAHADGYLENVDAMPLDLAIPDVGATTETMLSAAANAGSGTYVPIAAPSVTTGCMLSNGDLSRPSLVLATDPFARSAAGGSAPNPLLDGVPASVLSGSSYGGTVRRGAVLDEKYAKRLGLAPGDPLILLGNDAYGSFSMLETLVIAVVREASLPLEAGCVVDLETFAPTFGLEGRATAVSLWFASPDYSSLADSAAEPGAARAVADALAAVDGVEVRNFREISETYTAIFRFLDGFLAGMMAVFAIVAAVGMTNAILLSVQNRVKDLGTLRAIALTSRQAGMLVYAETVITSIAAAAAALIVGVVSVFVMNRVGFGIGFAYSDLGSALPDTIRPMILPARLATIAAVSAVFPLVAAFLPARSVRRMTIRESIGY